MEAKFDVLEQTHGVHLHAKFRLNRLILTPFGGEKLQILLFFGLWHFVVSPVGGNLRKLNMGAQLRAFPYPTVSKLFLCSNAFMAKSYAESMSFKSVKDRQTNQQIKNSTFLAALAVGKIRAPPNSTW